TPQHPEVLQASHLADEPSSASLERFAGFLRIPTVSSREAPDHTRNPETFTKAHEYLESNFQDVWKQLDVEKVAEHSLLITWPGTNSTLDPVLFISHQDVVPADDVDLWSVPPFSGLIKDGFVWGRGAIDTKFSLTAMLEAVTTLLASNFKPERTLLFGFGHDEEVGGEKGAGSIARLLASRGVQLDMVNDEGGMLSVDGLKPLTHTPVALIGTAEKGFQSLRVTVKGTGGHSSRPPLDASTVADRMARVILAVDAQPPPTRLVAPTTSLLKALAPKAPRAFRWILSHCDNPLVAPSLAKYMAAKSAEFSGVVRTTVAPTVLQAGSADNVMPQEGSIIFNFRPMPDETANYTKEFLEGHLGRDKAHAAIEYVGEYGLPSNVSAAQGAHWDIMHEAASTTLSDQDIVVAPYLLTGSTDSKHYASIVKGGIYRFSPLQLSMKAGDTRRIHGLDERVTVNSYLKAVTFYEKLIKLSGSLSQ
ncbi:hypothetical protein WJX84_003446, partial [Apatococcus fuscideae]